jgi:hypothetical protein
MSDTEQPTKTYRGNCHCGAFVFEVEAPEIKSVSDCKCSICSKRGYKWLVPQKPLVIIKDEGKLVHYSFASKRMDHQVSVLEYGIDNSVWVADRAVAVLRQLRNQCHGDE